MKISESRTEQVVQRYLQEVQTKGNKRSQSLKDKEPVAKGEDSVSITAKSREFEQAKELYRLLPDIREQEVNRVLADIKKGNIAAGEEIAQKIVHQSLIDGET